MSRSTVCLTLAAFIASSGALAQAVEPISLARLDIQRAGAVCTGQAVYVFEAKALALKADLGTTSRALAITVPCARLDAVTTYKPLPNNRGGQLSYVLDRVEFYLREDGTAAIDATYMRSPTDPDVLAVYGTDRVVVQYKNNALARMTNAIVGAVVVSGGAADWPASVVTVPLSVAP